MSAVDGPQNSLQEELAKVKATQKEIEGIIRNKKKLECQLEENKLVREELGFIEQDAAVYKMIGCVLVKQDSDEVKQNVDKRIDYISNELKRLENSLTDSSKKLEAQNKTITSLRNSMQQKKPAVTTSR